MKVRKEGFDSVEMAGYYKAKVHGYDLVESEKFGKYYKVGFEVYEGGSKKIIYGNFAYHDVLTPKMKLYKLFDACMEGKLNDDMDVEMEDLIGKPVIIRVENVVVNGNVYSNVMEVFPVSHKVQVLNEVPKDW